MHKTMTVFTMTCIPHIDECYSVFCNVDLYALNLKLLESSSVAFRNCSKFPQSYFLTHLSRLLSGQFVFEAINAKAIEIGANLISKFSNFNQSILQSKS